MPEVKDNTATVVRGARKQDAAAAVELLAALGYASSVAQVEERIAQSAESDDTRIFVAEAYGRVVGVASFHRIPLFHTEGFLGRITSLVVAPAQRQLGIGRLLVATLEQFAWAQRCIRVEVTSGDHRSDAHSFYERVGYEVDCRRFIKKKKEPNQTPEPTPGTGVAHL